MSFDPYATVLVTVVNNQRDWQIVREEGWYRIPVKQCPERAVNAAILAFYQTAAFGDEKWAINYYAPALKWEERPRRVLLPAEPTHPRADELYYKVTLGPVTPLPRPVPAIKWRRITFIVTHWQRLGQATEVGELLHGTIFEERLWGALRQVGILAELPPEEPWEEW